jgi:hypothetical protein
MPKEVIFMAVIKKVGVKSFAKIYALLASLFGLFIAVVNIPYILMTYSGTEAVLSVILLVVAMPVIYGAFGLLASAVIAGIYNYAAPRIGGVEVELGEVKARKARK